MPPSYPFTTPSLFCQLSFLLYLNSRCPANAVTSQPLTPWLSQLSPENGPCLPRAPIRAGGKGGDADNFIQSSQL